MIYSAKNYKFSNIKRKKGIFRVLGGVHKHLLIYTGSEVEISLNVNPNIKHIKVSILAQTVCRSSVSINVGLGCNKQVFRRFDFIKNFSTDYGCFETSLGLNLIISCLNFSREKGKADSIIIQDILVEECSEEVYNTYISQTKNKQSLEELKSIKVKPRSIITPPQPWQKQNQTQNQLQESKIINIKTNNFKINFNDFNTVIINFPGKTGEIFAASSVAKFIKINYLNITVKWECASRYKTITSLIPFVDEILCFDSDVIYKDFIDEKKNLFNYMLKQNKKGYYWTDKEVIYLNPYYNHLTNIDKKKPFNERFFECLGEENYTTSYHPELKFKEEDEKWANDFVDKVGKFGFIFPFGHDVNPLSFNKQEYIKLNDFLTSFGFTTILSDINRSLSFNVPFYDLIGLSADKLLCLFKKSSYIIGVNSGIIFSAMFLGTPVIIMENERAKYNAKHKIWDPNCVKLKDSVKIYSEKKLNVNKVCDFLKGRFEY